MNIWYIAKYANILKYGADTRQYYFCREFVKKGHKATLILANSSHLHPNQPRFKGPFMKECVNGVEIIWINLPLYGKATSVKRFWNWILFEYKIIRYYKQLSENKPDVIIASSLSFLSIISGFFCSKRFKAKFIFEVRDIWPQSLVDVSNLSKYNLGVLLLRKLEKFGYSKAYCVVGTMPGLYLHVQNSVKKKIKCECIPQGVDIGFYTNQQEQLSNEFIKKNIPQGKFIVTYAGTLGITYGLEYIIQAAKMLADRDSNIHFIFLGEGIMKDQLIESSKDLNNVTFVPRIPKKQVLDFLKHSTVLLHSFLMKKVFEYGISPNKFIDYMYSGRPIIVMFSGFPSLINEAGCGSFVPSENSQQLAEKLIEYATLPIAVLDEIGERGKIFLEKNRNYQVLAEKYLDLME